MCIELEKRPRASAFYAILSPFIALVLTVIAGGIMFAFESVKILVARVESRTCCG